MSVVAAGIAEEDRRNPGADRADGAGWGKDTLSRREV
jgi:hypothetical protein